MLSARIFSFRARRYLGLNLPFRTPFPLSGVHPISSVKGAQALITKNRCFVLEAEIVQKPPGAVSDIRWSQSWHAGRYIYTLFFSTPFQRLGPHYVLHA
jgi:hypothetical protein